MKRKKIPSNPLKAYNRGMRLGLKRGQFKSAEGLVGGFRKAYPKIEAAAQEMKKAYTEVTTPDLPTDIRALKWQGFTEAMNLIIASKR